MVDYLPKGVTLISPDPCSDPCYFAADHSYWWDWGTLAPDACDCVTLTVQVNGSAPPGDWLKNSVVITSNFQWDSATAWNKTECWCDNDPIIYVDETAAGSNDGDSWLNAYWDLQSALGRASDGCGDKSWLPRDHISRAVIRAMLSIWVDGVEVYGGFCTGGSVWNGRDPNRYETILNGQLDADTQATNIVTADTVDATTVLDGFTISGGVNGILCEAGADFQISHCTIESNGTGYSTNDNAGIYASGTCSPAITHSIVRYNEDGIRLTSGSPIITNNWIHNNSFKGLQVSSETQVRNNTIAYNDYGGIFRSSGSTTVYAKNCILWGNGGNLHMAGPELGTNCSATYSCVEGGGGGTNIDEDPCFAIDPNEGDFHLAWNSPCIDAGDPCDPCATTTEKDIDGLPRVLDGDGDASLVVDMGLMNT